MLYDLKQWRGVSSHVLGCYHYNVLSVLNEAAESKLIHKKLKSNRSIRRHGTHQGFFHRKPCRFYTSSVLVSSLDSHSARISSNQRVDRVVASLPNSLQNRIIDGFIMNCAITIHSCKSVFPFWNISRQ